MRCLTINRRRKMRKKRKETLRNVYSKDHTNFDSVVFVVKGHTGNNESVKWKGNEEIIRPDLIIRKGSRSQKSRSWNVLRPVFKPKGSFWEGSKEPSVIRISCWEYLWSYHKTYLFSGFWQSSSLLSLKQIAHGGASYGCNCLLAFPLQVDTGFGLRFILSILCAVFVLRRLVNFLHRR